MDRLTLFGLFAVLAMLISYALENRGSRFVLIFAGSCVLGSTYGFLQGAWPFGMVEAVWSVVAVRRWWSIRGLGTIMHIVVCIKQVPDSAQIRVHPVTNTIMRQGVPSIINPFDLFALEEALRLRDLLRRRSNCAVHGASDGGGQSAQSAGLWRRPRDSSDGPPVRRIGYSATTFALASAISKIGTTWSEPAIVFTGKQTIDGDTAQVGPGIAKRLNFTQLTYVSRIVNADSAAGVITVERRAEGGVQVLASRLPALITMLEDTNVMRRGTMADALRSARAEVIKWSAADAGITDVVEMRTARIAYRGEEVFAPAPRGKRKPISFPWSTARSTSWPRILMAEIFARNPAIEADLIRRAEGL